MRRARVLTVLAVLFLTIGAAGCGSDDTATPASSTPDNAVTGSNSSTTKKASSDQGAADLPDPCALLDASDVTGLLGAAAAPAKGPGGEAAVPFAICTWGSIGSPEGAIGIIVSTKGASGTDYGEMRAGVTASPTDKPVQVGDTAKIMQGGIVGGGRGIGTTLYFKKGAVSVIIGVSKESVDESALTAAGEAAARRLG